MDRANIVADAAKRRGVADVPLDQLVSEPIDEDQQQLPGSRLNAERPGPRRRRTLESGIDRTQGPGNDVRDRRILLPRQVGAGQVKRHRALTHRYPPHRFGFP